MSERILYYDCSAGISGDMHLGAMVDLGVPAGYLEQELNKLGLTGWKLQFTRDARQGIGGTRADVILAEGSHLAAPQALPHSHPHPHQPGHDAQPHVHRAHRDIVALIEKSSITSEAKRRALAILA